MSRAVVTDIIGVVLECKVKAIATFFRCHGWLVAKRSTLLGYDKRMAKQYTISQLGKAVSVPTTTLRYYERVGLLEPDDRSAGNYRLYADESLRRLKFIRAAQSIGFALNDVKALLGTYDGRTPSCCDVQVLIQERLSDIEQRLSDLRHVQRVLKAAMTKCKETEQAGCCHVIETLRSK